MLARQLQHHLPWQIKRAPVGWQEREREGERARMQRLPGAPVAPGGGGAGHRSVPVMAGRQATVDRGGRIERAQQCRES